MKNKLPSASTTNPNSGTLTKRGKKKGNASPLLPKEVQAQIVPPKGTGKLPEIWQSLLGYEMTDKLIREARGLKCKHCGEPIGELKTDEQTFGWIHFPEGKSFTFCHHKNKEVDLKKFAEPNYENPNSQRSPGGYSTKVANLAADKILNENKLLGK